MQKAPISKLRFDHLLEGTRWGRDRVVEFGRDGMITMIRNAVDADRETPAIRGYAVPGMPNVHSHTFQRLMAGLAESRRADQDSFWSWRHLMYDLAATLSPEDLHIVALQTWVEMLEGGYTAAAEFHYLHRPGLAQVPANPLAVATAIAGAAADAGIQLTMLPVLYQHSDFGPLPPRPEQERFTLATRDYVALWHALAAAPGIENLGVAFHSLRAVTPETMNAVLESLPLDQAPLHVHVAEQPAEIQACLHHHGRRPLALLAAEVGLDARWCLVHATHLGEAEARALAASGAVAGLCPTTEANLGDGLFDLRRHLSAGGSFGIGSDSHVSLDVREELRWLEYGQRLRSGQRNVVTTPGQPHVATSLWASAAAGGAAAVGQPVGIIEIGRAADITVVRTTPETASAAHAFDRFLFAPGGTISDVFVRGIRRVENGRCLARDQMDGRFEALVAELETRG